MNVLILDDQRTARRILVRILSALPELTVFEAGSLQEARAILERQPTVELALLDIRLSDDARNRDGLVLLGELQKNAYTTSIIVSSYSEMVDIRAAMRMGAFDYILKDELCDELVLPLVRSVCSRHALEKEVVTLRERSQAPSRAATSRILGSSTVMEQLRHVIRRVALSDRPVLVLGPTGSGKELVVECIHALSACADKPLFDLNCGALPESLIESQLFGHEKGAFTGADRKQEGYLTTVKDGTLFLDEIAELPLLMQAKLLRVLETRRFRAVGSTQELQFHGRLIAATHADLAERVQQGRFREDLYFRLNVLTVRVPSLAERREDIPSLVAHFVHNQHRPLRFSADAMTLLSGCQWPGNVRQLRNIIDRIAVLSEEDVITSDTLRACIEAPSLPQMPTLQQIARTILALPVPAKLDAIESALIVEALEHSNQNKSEAARLLGINRKLIERRLDRGLGLAETNEGKSES